MARFRVSYWTSCQVHDRWRKEFEAESPDSAMELANSETPDEGDGWEYERDAGGGKVYDEDTEVEQV